MLTRFFVENFQSLAYPQAVPIAPLTIIVGANSAGKSAIGRAIRLVQQSLEEADYREEGQIVFAGNRVELAGFASAVTNNARGEVIRIGLGVECRGRFASEHFEFSYSASEVTFEISSRNDKVSVELKFRVDYEISEAIQRPDYETFDFLEETEEPPRKILDRGSLLFNTTSPNAPFRKLEISIDGYAGALSKFLMDYLPEQDDRLQKGRNVERSQKIPDSIDGIASLNETEVIDPTNWTYLPVSLNGFIPRVLLSNAQMNSLENQTSGRVVRWLASLLRDVSRDWHQTISQILWVGPLRAINSGFLPKKNTRELIDSTGSNLQAALLSMKRGKFDRVSELLQTVTDGAYRLEKATMSSDNPLFPTSEQIVLVDMSSGKDIGVTFQDAGVGISQVLPILALLTSDPVELMRFSSGRTYVRTPSIFIEQPELHLHPKMQAELADIFINHLAKRQRLGRDKETVPRSQIVIETHSEAMILRVQRRIREGKLSKDDVSIIGVGAFAGGGSLAQEYRLSEDGSFIDELPGSFSDLRLNDLLGKD